MVKVRSADAYYPTVIGNFLESHAFSVTSLTEQRLKHGKLPRSPFPGSFAGIRIKPIYNLLDAIRLDNQPHSTSVDRFCLVSPLCQACQSSGEQANFIWMRARV
jgi:hypothetical protein